MQEERVHKGRKGIQKGGGTHASCALVFDPAAFTRSGSGRHCCTWASPCRCPARAGSRGRSLLGRVIPRQSWDSRQKEGQPLTKEEVLHACRRELTRANVRAVEPQRNLLTAVERQAHFVHQLGCVAKIDCEKNKTNYQQSYRPKLCCSRLLTVQIEVRLGRLLLMAASINTRATLPKPSRRACD